MSIGRESLTRTNASLRLVLYRASTYSLEKRCNYKKNLFLRLQVLIIWDICQFILIFFGLYSYIDYFQSPQYITCIVTWHTNAWLKCLNFVMLYASYLIRSIVWWWIHDKITPHNITNVRANKYFQHFINNFTRSEQNGKRHPRMPISPWLRLSLRFWRQAFNWR